ncbi:molybdopterin biosynthesis protein MoeB [Geobacter sp. OR-1]|uniref:YceI family protein n=1 Tax=Geobacter sp. OR-1 TaxID=1266765 RepID=UPI00054376BB|nr:YceI family protein [Geobacter sp. OR-1]GAM08608.1 molybdopterin biosynthesis protein MoeB [Geobacter sp. OR-1]
MTATISCQELHERLAGNDSPLVIDVLPPEVYAGRHIPGACNACIYETIFLNRAIELAPDHEKPIVLYDASGTTMAAATAQEKLLAAGYRSVRVLTGGLSGWAASGYPVETVEPLPEEPVLRDGIYRLDPSASVLEWTGRNFNNRHYGRIPFRSGEIVISNGELLRGEMSLDMTGISNLDLQDEAYRQMLVRHLKSDDFFNVDRYPVAAIAITGWQPIAAATPGTPDHYVQAELTIKGITRPIAFPAAVAPQEDGSLKAHATFDIDRTKWNICYGSGKLFEKLGMHLVHDRIDIELFIVARNSG